MVPRAQLTCNSGELILCSLGFAACELSETLFYSDVLRIDSPATLLVL